MINTRKRSGCLIKEQIIYLSRKSVQHNPETRHCWPRRVRKTWGRRDSSSTSVNRENAPLIQNLWPDLGRRCEGLGWAQSRARTEAAAEGGPSPSSEKNILDFKIPQWAKSLLSLALYLPPPSQYFKYNENINALITTTTKSPCSQGVKMRSDQFLKPGLNRAAC